MQFIKFFLFHLVKNPVYLLYYLKNYFSDDMYLHVNFLTRNELFSLILSWKSLIRYGDGEVYLINKWDIGYQNFSYSLRNELLKIVQEYSPSSPYILALPAIDINKSNADLKKIWRLQLWLPMKIFFMRFCKIDMHYGDAHIFYYWEFRKSLPSWIQNKHLIIVANNKVLDTLDNNLFSSASDISFISCPNKNAYESRVLIQWEIDKVLGKEEKRNTVIFFSCWPLSKVLCFDYSNKGFQSIDMWIGIELLADKSHSNEIRDIKWKSISR